MYERFTDRSRKVMQLANQEAQRFNHDLIGPEHILLGLLKEGCGVGANALKNLGLDLSAMRLAIEKRISPGPDLVRGKLPQTSEAKQVINDAMEEARGLDHNYVGTEHILLGLLRQEEGIAATALASLGIKLDDVREEVLHVLGPAVPQPSSPKASPFEQDILSKFDEEFPAELQAVVAQFDVQIERLTREKEEAVADQNFPHAAVLRCRVDHLSRTKRAMLRYWIANAPIDPSWLSWNHGAVVALAEKIEQQFAWKELPSLADYLQLAGCTDEQMLAHCRQSSEHIYQCWVVDLILSRAALSPSVRKR